MMMDDLTAASISANLKTRFIGQRVIYYPSLVSTMEAAKQGVRQGAAEGTIVVAGEQTGGRGRRKRAWLSPGGNIAFSVILFPGVEYLPNLIMLSSLAVAYSIETVTGLKTQLKWPNDVLIAGKKVCGILIESGVRRNKVDYAVIGIGINVNLRPADFPEISSVATSLCHESGRAVSCLDLIRCLLVNIEDLYLALLSGQPVYEPWRDRLITLGTKIGVVWGKSRYEGIAESVTRDGSLLLRCSDGSFIKIVAGDVTLHNYEQA